MITHADMIVLFGYERGFIRATGAPYDVQFVQRFTFQDGRLRSVRIVAARNDAARFLIDTMQAPNASFEEIAATWISYHLWSASRPTRQNPTAEERHHDDAEANRQGFWAWEAVEALVRNEPEQGWLMILRLMELSPDDRVLANVAAGPLENLLRQNPHAFIDRVEQQARDAAKFRRCLSGVWGWSSIPEDIQARIERASEGEEPL